MIKKTVIRRGWKYLPMSIEMQSAEVAETAAESGVSTTIDNTTGEIIIDNTAQDAIANAEAKVDAAIKVYAGQINKSALDVTHNNELDLLRSSPESCRAELRKKLTDAYNAKVAELTTKQGA
jgi:recombinational DNA repair protein RecT